MSYSSEESFNEVIVVSSNPRVPFSPQEVLTWPKSGFKSIRDSHCFLAVWNLPHAMPATLSTARAFCHLKQSSHFTCIFQIIATHLFPSNVQITLTWQSQSELTVCVSFEGCLCRCFSSLSLSQSSKWCAFVRENLWHHCTACLWEESMRLPGALPGAKEPLEILSS